jgi:Protein of unknown function (DUF1203)
MSFRISGLPAEQFADLFGLSDQELAARGAFRRIADARTPGYPCRVSLTDSRPGDELLLVNYEHHPVSSPYRMRFAIFVRKGEETYSAVDEVPEQLRLRTLAVRAFDADAMMIVAIAPAAHRDVAVAASVGVGLVRHFACPVGADAQLATADEIAYVRVNGGERSNRGRPTAPPKSGRPPASTLCRTLGPPTDTVRCLFGLAGRVRRE